MYFQTKRLGLALANYLFVAFLFAEEAKPVGQWQFNVNSLQGKVLRPTIGSWEGKVTGTASLTKEQPFALEAKKGFDGIVLNQDLNQSGLPKESLSVSAWARIDKPIQWGGILGAMQDNGNYERGWLLGYGKDSFYFAVATEQGPKRLTYLNTKETYAPGYWYHLVGTYDGQSQRIYLDGKLSMEAKAQKGPIAYPPEGRFVIGAYWDKDEHRTMEGRLERITLWNRALDAQEIATLFKERKRDFPEIDPVADPTSTKDWTTFLHDNERSGQAAATIQGELSLRWTHRLRLPPKPAWPPPAKQDFWHKKYNLKPRVVYDRAFHVIGAGERLYLTSSADDQVRCLSLQTGKALWNQFADGPIRLTPTLVDDRLLVGSDDGQVRCLQAVDGKLLWVSRPPELGSRWIPGNGRVIHERPIRTGILADKQTGYFGAGLFPTQGTFLFSMDLRDGRILDKQKLSISPQGYLSRKNGKLFAPTGRNPAGAFLSRLTRRGKPVPATAKEIPDKYPHAFIGAGKLKFAGGDGEVGVFQTDGSLSQKLSVTGKAYSLAVVRGHLLVSTDAGVLHCFTAGEGEPVHHRPDAPEPFPENKALAQKALAANKATKGYCLVAGVQHADIAVSIARSSEMRVIVTVRNAKALDKLRRELDRAGLYGNEIVAHPGAAPLPYADHLFNLVVDPSDTLDKQELKRILRPSDGIGLTGPNLEKTHSKEALEGGGEWTHLYADPGNTSCSQDQKVGVDLSLQWFGRPGPERLLDRHHRSVSPLSKNGFLFIPGNERIFGVDTYNGAVLWETEVPESRRIAIMRDAGSMAVDDHFLYVASGRQCLALEVKTGKVEKRFSFPVDANASNHEWGYVAQSDGLLIGSAVKSGGIRRIHGPKGLQESYWDNRPPVCSDSLFAFDPKTGQHRWTYRPDGNGSLVNSSIAINDGRVHFVESEANDKSGRVLYDRLMNEKEGFLVSVELKSGKVLGKVSLGKKKGVQNLFVVATDGVVAVVKSRNEKTLHYDATVFDAKSGELLWHRSQNNGNKLNGSHGEQDRHPVVLNGELYVEPMIYNLKSGIPAEGRKLARGGGCGAMSASTNALYFRSRNPTAYVPSTGKFKKITTVSRPGCWINAIPAGGLLLIPEASSGCTCPFPIQCSLAFVPKTKKEP